MRGVDATVRFATAAPDGVKRRVRVGGQVSDRQ